MTRIHACVRAGGCLSAVAGLAVIALLASGPAQAQLVFAPDLGRTERLLQNAPTPSGAPAKEDARKAPVVIRQKRTEPPPRAEPSPSAPPRKMSAEAPPGSAPPTSGGVQFFIAPAPPASAAAPSLAQAPPSVTRPLPQLPGELGRVDRPLTDPRPAPLAEPVTPPAPAPEPAPGTGRGPSFVLQDVVIEGASVYPPEELRSAIERYIGQTVTFDAVPEIEEAIARKYRSDGYILARALAPENQSLDPAGAVLKVVVFEGYIDKVRLDPLDYEVGERGERVREILKKIERGCRDGDAPSENHPCPLHRSVLERYLLLANDLPGVKASAVIQPAQEATGGADLFVTVSEKWYQGFVKGDNRGTVYSGPFRADIGGSLNNLTDFYERTSVRVIAANPLNELLLYDINESLPISSEGTLLVLGYNRSQSKPGDVLRDANIKSKTLGASVTIVHPWLRSRSENLFLRGGFDYRNSKTQIGLDETTLFDDRTRALSIGSTYDLADRYFGVNLVDVKFTKGLPIMAASEKGDQVSRGGRVLAEASGDFAKLNLEVSRLQRVISEVNVLVAASGQYSFSNLLVAEQFGFGGDRYGRSYDPSEILGDHGVAAKFEVQYNPTWIGDAAGFVSLPPDTLRALQFYAYYDVGMVWQRAEDDVLLAAGVVAKDRDAGASAGFGVRFNILDYLAGYVEVAKPLTRDLAAERAKNEDGKDLRYFFNLATNF